MHLYWWLYSNILYISRRVQAALRGVVARRYQHHDEVPQLHTMLSEPLD